MSRRDNGSIINVLLLIMYTLLQRRLSEVLRVEYFR